MQRWVAGAPKHCLPEVVAGTCALHMYVCMCWLLVLLTGRRTARKSAKCSKGQAKLARSNRPSNQTAVRPRLRLNRHSNIHIYVSIKAIYLNLYDAFGSGQLNTYTYTYTFMHTEALAMSVRVFCLRWHCRRTTGAKMNNEVHAHYIFINYY